MGNHLLRELNRHGIPARVLHRENTSPLPLAGLRFESCIGDLRDAPSLHAACRGVSTVFHAAAEVRIGKTCPERFQEINIEGTRALSLAAGEAGARFVFVSSSDTIKGGSKSAPADEDSPFDRFHASPYSLSKWQAEKQVLENVREGLDAVIVNPSFLLGPNDWKPSSGAMLLAVSEGLGWIAPRGEICLADVRDVARAIVNAGDHGRRGERYLLSGVTMSYREAWKQFAAFTGSRPPLATLGPLLTLAAGATGDLFASMTKREPPFNSAALRAAAMKRHYSSAKAERELDYRCRPLEETIRDAWNWMCESAPWR